MAQDQPLVTPPLSDDHSDAFAPSPHPPVIADSLIPYSPICDFEAIALSCAQHGLHVHPLTPHAKTPLLQNWPVLGTTDPEIIHDWACATPNANTGIISGPESRIIILDVDARHGGMASLRALSTLYGDLPVTPEVFTPGGLHIYLKHPGIPVKSGQLAQGIDLRADGANVVAPGSLHPSGRLYAWNDALHPDIVPFAAMPSWLLGMIQTAGLAPSPALSTQQVNLLASREPVAVEVLTEGRLNGGGVAALFSQEKVIKRCLPLLGLSGIEIGKKFCCVLHPEENPSASVMPPRAPGDPYIYMDFHEREPGRKGYPLPLVYYRLKTGKHVPSLPKPTFLVWSLRLLRDAGVLESLPVRAARIEEDAPLAAKDLYRGFQELLGLKWLIDKDAPSPYTWRFIEGWADVSQRVAASGMKWLLGKGYLRCVGSVVQAGRSIALFALGTRAFIRRRADVEVVSRKQEEVIEEVRPALEALYRENREYQPKEQQLPQGRICGHQLGRFTFGDILICQSCFALLPDMGGP